MPHVDFRTLAFDTDRLRASGRSVGSRVFPKLYAIENLLRTIVHSILTAQIGASWWDTHVDQTIRDDVVRSRGRYARRPRNSSPGRHGIYHVDLFTLNEIIRSNGALLRQVIPDLDTVMVNIEQIRLPRNVVAHMNWLHDVDRGRINVLHADLLAVLGDLRAAQIPISAPPV